MRYTFQQSFIWDGANPQTPDPATKPVRIKSKSEERARGKLPTSGLGRHWILINTEETGNAHATSDLTQGADG